MADYATGNQDIGSYTTYKHNSAASDPVKQMRGARRNVAEMKARAVVDHTWELFGTRPEAVEGDLKKVIEYAGMVE